MSEYLAFPIIVFKGSGTFFRMADFRLSIFRQTDELNITKPNLT